MNQKLISDNDVDDEKDDTVVAYMISDFGFRQTMESVCRVYVVWVLWFSFFVGSRIMTGWSRVAGICHVKHDVLRRNHNVQYCNAIVEYKPMRWIWIIKCASEIKTWNMGTNRMPSHTECTDTHTHTSIHRSAYRTDNTQLSLREVSTGGFCVSTWITTRLIDEICHEVFCGCNFGRIAVYWRIRWNVWLGEYAVFIVGACEFWIFSDAQVDVIYFRIMWNERCTSCAPC